MFFYFGSVYLHTEHFHKKRKNKALKSTTNNRIKLKPMAHGVQEDLLPYVSGSFLSVSKNKRFPLRFESELFAIAGCHDLQPAGQQQLRGSGGSSLHQWPQRAME